jgi:hypothetical protein
MGRVHRTTFGRLERGDTGVSPGVFLTMLKSLQELINVELILSQPQPPKDRRKAYQNAAIPVCARPRINA